MEWVNDARQARSGDAAATARLAEYLTPFVHGVALAHAPHHVTNALVPQVLAEAARGLAAVSDEQHVGQHYAAVARKLAREAAASQKNEVHDASAQVTEARQVVARLRAVPESTRERLLLRLVEGVPGPELAQVLRVMEGELKTDLERGVAEAARVLGQAPPSPGDTYLWELLGTPQPLVARLEMLLPVLRYDPGAAAPEASTNGRPLTHSTHLSLGPVGEAKRPTVSAAPPAHFPTEDETTNAHVEPLREATHGGSTEKTRGASDLPPQANPFEPAVRTVAATDLPVAAQGVVPVMPRGPPSRSNPKLVPPAPAVRSSPSRPPVPDASTSQRLKGFTASEETKAQPPPALARAQARAAASPPPVEPTDPLAAALGQETRVGVAPSARPESEPALGDAAEPEPTRMQPMPAVPRLPVPPLTPRTLLQGSTPFILAGLLVVAASVAGWTGLFTSETRMKKAWTLVPVVVAAQDMNEGDLMTPDSLAVRQMPDIVSTVSFVKPDSITFVLNQRLIAPMQEGDPLCWSHLSDLEHSRRLAVQKRGRAYTIPTSVISSIGRHLKPGDRVDVVASIERPISKSTKRTERGKTVTVASEETEQVAVTLMQDIVVLATGKILPTTRTSSMDSRALAYANVSLLVLPEEAEQLALAQTLGRLTLTLRAEEDHDLLDPVRREWTNISTLITGERTRKLHKRREEVIKMIRGGGKH